MIQSTPEVFLTLYTVVKAPFRQLISYKHALAEMRVYFEGGGGLTFCHFKQQVKPLYEALA